jgi:putative photosynthetic complex assembly protein
MAGQLEAQMKHRDRDMVPKFLVQGMFALMLGAVALVTYAQLTDRPNEGVLVQAPIVAEVSLTLTGQGRDVYTVTNAAGDIVALSSDDKAGFIGVMGLVIDRRRDTYGVTGNPPVRVVRRDNGHIAVIDDATGLVTELIGYGADNVAAFAQFVD